MFYMADDFTVVKRNQNGTTVNYRFTSHAQARQFMEQNTGQAPPAPHKPNRRGVNKRASSTPINPKTAEQRALKALALKQFKGL